MPVPPLTLRLVKGSPLTIQEQDDNFANLRDAHDALEARVEATIDPNGLFADPPLYYESDVGADDDYVATLTPAPTTYADIEGKLILLKVAYANDDAACTLELNSLGTPKAITKTGTVALVAGDIKAGQIVPLVYDGTRFQIIGI